MVQIKPAIAMKFDEGGIRLRRLRKAPEIDLGTNRQARRDPILYQTSAPTPKQGVTATRGPSWPGTGFSGPAAESGGLSSILQPF